MQSLRGIRDIHESGVDEHSFSEVKCVKYFIPHFHSLLVAVLKEFLFCIGLHVAF